MDANLIAGIVLRAYDSKPETLRPMIPALLAQVEAIEPGKVYYIYADEKLKESDQRKGKGPESKQ